MPTIENLESALLRQEDLVTKVAELKTSNRRLAALLAMMFAVLLGVGTITWYSRDAANHARAASAAAEAVAIEAKTALAATEETRLELQLSACKSRNSANVVTRGAFMAFYDALNPFLTTPGGQSFIEQLREKLPTAEKQDSDCNKDGVVTALDYP